MIDIQQASKAGTRICLTQVFKQGEIIFLLKEEKG